MAAAMGISIPYASQLLSGARARCSSDIALKAFRIFGVRLGLLADMSDADIEKLCAEREDRPCVHPAQAGDATARAQGVNEVNGLTESEGATPSGRDGAGGKLPPFGSPAPSSPALSPDLGKCDGAGDGTGGGQ